MRFFDFVFGCRHAELSRVFTIGGRTYRVCWSCGARFHYSLANMRMGGRFADAYPSLPGRAQAGRCSGPVPTSLGAEFARSTS